MPLTVTNTMITTSWSVTGTAFSKISFSSSRRSLQPQIVQQRLHDAACPG